MCKGNKDVNVISGVVYFPSGQPVPEVLTEEEAINFLRIDTIGVKNPSTTLRYYREEGLLEATRISKKLFYTKQQLLQFLQMQTELTNPNDGEVAGYSRY